MHALLAYAEQEDLSGSQWQTVMLCGVVVAVAAVMAVVVIGLARSRRHRQADAITGMALLWALGTIGLGMYTVMGQIQWKKDYTQNIMSGYLDPRDKSGAPGWHWLFWGILAVIYVALVVFARAQGKTKAAPPVPPDGRSNE